MQSVATIGIDPQRGFLPANDPLPSLPAQFAAWESAVAALPALLAVGGARRALDDLPQVDAAHLAGEAEQERALLLLSYLGHAYVFGDAVVAIRLPPAIAIPWHATASALKRYPVLSYASHILHNWQRIDPTLPIALDNLARQAHFLGGMDEDWFGMIHVVIEAEAAPGLRALAEAHAAARAGEVPRIAAALRQVSRAMAAMLAVLNRMPERCDPYIYYHRVRPYLLGWQDNPALPEGMYYPGVAAYGERPQHFRGGSGAQSAIVPAIDDALGIVFDDNPFGIYMRSLREYIPFQHRTFLERLRRRPSIRSFIQQHATGEPDLVAAYNTCLEDLAGFRSEHLIFAARYIQAQTPHSPANPNAIGTGGTPFMRYLKQHVAEVLAHRISE